MINPRPAPVLSPSACAAGEGLLGEVVDGGMRLSRWGQVVSHYWKRIPDHAAHVELDEWAEVSNQIILLARGWPRWKDRTWECLSCRHANLLRPLSVVYRPSSLAHSLISHVFPHTARTWPNLVVQ